MKRILLAALLTATANASAAQLVLLQQGDISHWSYQTFDDIAETAYRRHDGFLAADSQQSASGYILRKEIDLAATPYLHFKWRVNAVSPNDAEKSKAGDDFAVRLSFVGQSGIKYRALTLVYAQAAEIGENWQSPYSGLLSDIRLYTIARHTPETIGQWQQTHINLAEIWREHLSDNTTIGLIGIMTDSDNKQGTARTDYADIILSPLPHISFPIKKEQI